jgi:hypothetical protein
MGRAKEIIVKVIPAKIANEFVKQHHYSGTIAPSIIHFGVFLDNKMHGAVSIGKSTQTRLTQAIFYNLGWNEYCEINRIAFDDYLPANSESRVLGFVIKQIKKTQPHIRCILSYADASQCGDGAIYRATGFLLTQIRENRAIGILPDGERISRVTFGLNKQTGQIGKLIRKYNVDLTKGVNERWYAVGMKWIDGWQLRYVYFIDKNLKMKCEILPFSKIDELGAGMYKGKKVSLADRKQNAAVAHLGERLASSQEGAFDATVPLQLTEIKQ